MNEGLLEAESAVFSIGFCKPAVKKKMKKIHFSPEMCEKKSNVHKFLQDHCNRGTKLMGNFCIDIGTNGAVSGIREEHFFKKGTNCQN